MGSQGPPSVEYHGINFHWSEPESVKPLALAALAFDAIMTYLPAVAICCHQPGKECGPYVALKHWLQRSEVPLPAVRDVPMPSAERAIAAAQHAIEVADAAGDEWLKV